MKAKATEKSYIPEGKGAEEFHVLIKVTDASLDFEEQLREVVSVYSEVTKGRTVHFRRIFLSDAANQAQDAADALAAFGAVPTSFVQQPPLDGTKLAMWVYCTGPMDIHNGIPCHNGYSHHWDGSLTSPGENPHAQMEGIFGLYDRKLQEGGLSVSENTVRTWIFCRDADVNYSGVVSGRKAYFDSIGLTSSTHYIASTGIEGRHPLWKNTVEMDAYSVGGLDKGQIRYLKAPDHLSPTIDYGVTFERGSAITYGDRRHIFISGTASIDSKGKVVHPGNVSAQTSRMLENVSALLAEAGATLGDIVMAIVYLRDASDYPKVRKVVSGACPGLEAVYVLAPVCRPAWLVEMECIGITWEGCSRWPEF